ncbi:retrovirus-related pol polyprotein from transposon TNT 1-94 [Tanacetum coccineum]
MHAHDNGALLDTELSDQCDAFDSDVDEGPTTQTMFMANLTSEEAGASYDSNIPSEVQDREYDSDCEDKYHEVHEMQSDVQHNYVVDSDADYMSDSNIIPSIVLVMSNHARPVVHDSEDTRDMAEITRKRMMEKMKSPLYENDRKKAETSVPKPLSALTVSCEPYNANDVTDLLEQNERFRAEIEKVKQHYKELFESIQITRASTNEKTYTLLTQIKDLKAQLEGNLKVSEDSSFKTKVLALEYVIGTCPKEFTERDNKAAAFIPLTRKKQVTFTDTCSTSTNNTQKHGVHQKAQQSNVQHKSVNNNKVEDHLEQSKISVNATPTVKIVLNKGKQIWKPKGKLSDNSLNKTKRVWKATGKLFADIGYQWRPTGKKFALGELCPLTKLSVKCCSKHMTGNRSKLKNFVEKFIGTVRFGNDHFGAIMGYGDYVIGDSVISRVYYVEGLGHNLFSVGQFCDSDLEIAFKKHSCFVRDMNGVDLLKGSRSTNLYTISIDDMMKSSPVCLLSKASKTKSWLWHRRLNHLNFGTINDLAQKDLVRGLPRLKFEKDHLCSACQLGKSKKYSHKPKSENTNMEVLHTLHMDLCGPMRVQRVGIFHQKSVPRTPQQNGVVERQNRTLVEVARTMLIFSKALMFLWAEVVATACYTQNRSLIHTRHNKTSYELVHDKKPDLTFLRVFGALCYPTNDIKDLDCEPVPMTTVVNALIVSTNTSVSTMIAQDAPSIRNSLSSSQVHPLVFPQGVAAGPTIEDTSITQAGLHPSVNPVAGEPSSAQSTSGDVIEPKNFKMAVNEDSWFEAIQDKIHEFDRLKVWELVPRPDYVMVIGLKWIYKVKLDEYGDVLKNKAPTTWDEEFNP